MTDLNKGKLAPEEMNLLDKHVMKGNVSVRKHPRDELYIFNYTPKVQYQRLWDEITLMCRGLILGPDGEVIARPPKKFFNYEELCEVELSEKIKKYDLGYVVTEKMDGSLGIAYIDSNNNVAIATRGSFDNPGAKLGTELINANPDLIRYIHRNRDVTFFFEIIDPTNRIVVDYGNVEKLIYLGSTKRCSNVLMNVEYHKNIIPCFVVAETTYSMDVNTLFDDVKKLKKENLPNKEGYVFTLFGVNKESYRFKVKFEDYIQRHKLRGNLSEFYIWTQLSSGKDPDSIIQMFPDEFHDWGEEVCDKLLNEFSDIYTEAYALYEFRPMDMERGNFAAWAKEQKYPQLLFKIYDEREIDDIVWKIIKPKKGK